MTHEVSDDHTAQYKEKLPLNTWQVASKGLIASAATESLSIQQLWGEDQGLSAGNGMLFGFAASPIVSVSA